MYIHQALFPLASILQGAAPCLTFSNALMWPLIPPRPHLPTLFGHILTTLFSCVSGGNDASGNSVIPHNYNLYMYIHVLYILHTEYSTVQYSVPH